MIVVVIFIDKLTLCIAFESYNDLLFSFFRDYLLITYMFCLFFTPRYLISISRRFLMFMCLIRRIMIRVIDTNLDIGIMV
jgi:hypothetical protein